MLSIVALACIVVLELRFVGLDVENTSVGDTPVTVYNLPSDDPKPPVIIAHGFAGSRQMMDQIAVSLARQGFLVASVDLPGHGRNQAPMLPDITNIDGTTEQLVDAVEQVADAVVGRPDSAGPVSFVGHSMATDIVIRASQRRDDVGGVVAISMYSTAVTETSPEALLVLSGATEGRLRGVGLEAARQIDPEAQEGMTVTSDGVIRRTSAAPFVGHVGVLYAPHSLNEITDWLRNATNSGGQARLDQTGWIAGALFVALVLLIWPLSKLVPARDAAAVYIPRRTFLMCLLAPIPVVLLIAALPVVGLYGKAAFGSLALILAAWGGIQLALLRKAGIAFQTPEWSGALFYLGCAFTFALALDRYGAAFMPSGERGLVALTLLLGTVPVMLADTMLVNGASIWRRLLTRFALFVGLASAMAVKPTELGLAFTVIPVMVLFFLVYGTMAMWIAARRGPGGVALGKAVVLAWAIAASTPMFLTASP